jgi:signal transduction histidine kinase
VRRLEFEFGPGIAHTNDEGFLFQTRLEGVESEWSLPHAQAAREFTGLPHGSYVFLARAMDRFGRTGEPLQFAFTLRAPWYATPWAIAAWIAALVLIVAATMRLRLRNLQRQTERLNELVNERTRELSLSNTARSEFLDGLSHEIRRPINGIVSLTRKFEEEGLAPAQREHVRLLRLGGESLMRVFNDVLNFSKTEYGAVPVEERPFSLRKLLTAAIAECGAAGPPPTLHLPDGVADTFLGDDSKLLTIVSNFLANTQKYAPDAPVEITASCLDAGGDACDVLIEVADGGPGVPAEEQELIFKRFVRGSIAKRTRVPGTGIGLATCRLTARLIGGSVGVESPSEHALQRGWPGPGATFFLKIKLKKHPAALTSAAAGLPESVRSPSRSRSE